MSKWEKLLIYKGVDAHLAYRYVTLVHYQYRYRMIYCYGVN